MEHLGAGSARYRDDVDGENAVALDDEEQVGLMQQDREKFGTKVRCCWFSASAGRLLSVADFSRTGPPCSAHCMAPKAYYSACGSDEEADALLFFWSS